MITFASCLNLAREWSSKYKNLATIKACFVKQITSFIELMMVGELINEL